MIHSGFSCISSCDLNDRSIDIISLNVHIDIVLNQIICLVDHVIPHLLRDQVRPLFCREGTIHSRRDICSHHCSFYRKCSTSAERIYEYTVFLPWCQLDECCCQSLRDRRFAGNFTVSSLVQGHTGCIDSYCHDIFHQKYTYRIRSSVFRKPLDSIIFLQPSDHCFLHNRLDV